MTASVKVKIVKSRVEIRLISLFVKLRLPGLSEPISIFDCPQIVTLPTVEFVVTILPEISKDAAWKNNEFGAVRLLVMYRSVV